MQDDQQTNDNSINGIGLPPALQNNDDSNVGYVTPQTDTISNDIQSSSNETPIINPNDTTRTPLNSVSSASDTPKSETSSFDTSRDLLEIKKRALQQLQPLVDRLDLSPEEKFNTTMMMIQASDDQSLINKAYDAAQKITDEKDKAQALLDIVNEINYFTHNEEVK